MCKYATGLRLFLLLKKKLPYLTTQILAYFSPKISQNTMPTLCVMYVIIRILHDNEL